MSRLLFESRAAVLACEAQQALIEKEIELEKLKQQRKPLTLREIGAVCGNFSDETIKVVRQTEAAHGIKENT